MSRVLYVFAVAIAMATLLEVAARHLNTIGYVRSRSLQRVYELRPSRSEINRFGQRDHDRPLEKRSGQFRVACLGDSYTYGVGVPPDQIYTRVAERELRARGLDADVINFGVPGYNTAVEAAVAEELVPAFDPDLVVVQFCRNDFRLPNFIQTRGSGLVIRSYALLAFLGPLASRWSHGVKRGLLGYHWEEPIFPAPGLERVPLEDRNPIGDPERVPDEYRFMIGEAGIRAAYRRIAEQSRREEWESAVLLGWGGKDGDASAWAAAEGLEVIDVWPPVTAHLEETGLEFPSLWVAPDDNHPNKEGHQVLAAALSRWLDEHAPRGRTASVPDAP